MAFLPFGSLAWGRRRAMPDGDERSPFLAVPAVASVRSDDAVCRSSRGRSSVRARLADALRRPDRGVAQLVRLVSAGADGQSSDSPADRCLDHFSGVAGASQHASLWAGTRLECGVVCFAYAFPSTLQRRGEPSDFVLVSRIGPGQPVGTDAAAADLAAAPWPGPMAQRAALRSDGCGLDRGLGWLVDAAGLLRL